MEYHIFELRNIISWFLGATIENTKGHYITNPNNALGEIPENYYTSALFDPLNMGNLMNSGYLDVHGS